MTLSRFVPRLVLITGLLSPLPGMAVQQKAPTVECGALTDAAKRRSCQDSLLLESDLHAPLPAGPSLWFTASYNSAADNSPSVLATLPAVRGKNRFGKSLRLNVRCKNKQLSAWVDWGESLVQGTIVTARFDGKAERWRWQFSADQKATFYLGKAELFIDRLLNAQLLVTEAVSRGEKPIIGEFNLQGSDRALSPLRQACGM